MNTHAHIDCGSVFLSGIGMPTFEVELTFLSVDHDVLAILLPPDDVGPRVAKCIAAEGQVFSLSYHNVRLVVLVQYPGWN